MPNLSENVKQVLKKIDTSIANMDIQTSNDSTLVNSKAGSLEMIEMVGATEQKTMSGKNLLNVPEVHTFTQSWNGKPSIPAGTYKLSWDSSVHSGTSSPYIRFDKNGVGKYLSATGGEVEIALTVDETVIDMYSNGNDYSGSAEVTATINKLMLSKVGGEYEPYCGGVPSPNPEFPQAIENTFDCVEMEQGTILSPSGSYEYRANRVRTVRHIPCKSGDNIVVKVEKAVEDIHFRFYDNNNNLIIGEAGTANGNEYSFIAPSGVTKFKFIVARTDNCTPLTVGKITLTVNGKYVGQIVEHGKNFYNPDNSFVGFYNSSLEFTSSGGYVMSEMYPTFEGVISQGADSEGYRYVYYYDENMNIVKRAYSSDATNVHVIDYKNYSYFRVGLTNNSSTGAYTTDLQIEAGSVATSYEPYTEKIVTFFMNEPLRVSDKIVKKDGVWYVERNRGAVTINVDTIGTNSQGLRTKVVEPSNKKTYPLLSPICTHATRSTDSTTPNSFVNNPANFVLKGTADDTLETMQAKYNGAILEYELAAPIYETLDIASQEALNSLETFDTATYIGVDSKVKPESTTVTYGTSEVGARALTNTSRIKKEREACDQRFDLLEIQTSEDYEIHGCKAGGLRLLEMDGTTEQKTLSGKNLLDSSGLVASTANGVTFTPVYNNGLLEYINVNGTATALTEFYIRKDFIFDEDVKLNGQPDGGSSSTYSIRATKVGGGNEIVIKANTNTSIYIQVIAGQTVSNLKFYPMLRLATETDPTYEPYCGGTPSPNPDYPQAIENVGDCVEMTNGYYAQTTGEYKTSTGGSICCKRYIPCAENDMISVVIPKQHQMYFLFYKDETFVSSVGSVTNTKHSITVPSGVNAFKFYVEYTGTTPDKFGKITLTVNGKYVGQIVEWGRNELDYVDMISGNLNSSGAVESDATWVHKIVEIDSTCVYWLFNGNQGDAPKHCWYDNDMKFISAISTTPITRLITPPSNAKYLGVSYVRSNKDIKLQKQKVATFFINEPLRATDRVVRKDGVIYENHKRITRVLNGSEVWGLRASDGLFIITLPNKKLKECDIMCDHYKTTTSTPPNVGEMFGYNSYYGNHVIAFNDSTCTTIDEWKAKLQNNPITLEYDRAEETLTPLDPESQKALNSLETFKDVTYLEVGSKIKPSGIKSEFGKSGMVAYTLKALLNSETVLAMQSVPEAAAIPAVVNEPEVVSEE